MYLYPARLTKCNSDSLQREKKDSKPALLWSAQFSTTAPKIDAVLCYGFISITKSFDSNVAATEIIIGVASCHLIAWHQHM